MYLEHPTVYLTAKRAYGCVIDLKWHTNYIMSLDYLQVAYQGWQATTYLDRIHIKQEKERN